MANRSKDWFNQALRDLEQAEDSQRAERHVNGPVLPLSRPPKRPSRPSTCTWGRRHGGMW